MVVVVVPMMAPAETAARVVLCFNPATSHQYVEVEVEVAEPFGERRVA